MNNNFFIKDGFLSFEITNNFVKKYFYLENYAEDKIENILNILNTNIKNVKILDNPISKSTSILINNKEYIRVEFNEDETTRLFIFKLDSCCTYSPSLPIE